MSVHGNYDSIQKTIYFSTIFISFGRMLMSIYIQKMFLYYCRPVSAYALFFRDTQAAIKGQNPSASFGEVSKIVASMWDVLASEHKNVSIYFFMQLKTLN